MVASRNGLWLSLILLVTATLIPLNMLDRRADRARLAASNQAVVDAMKLDSELRWIGKDWLRQDENVRLPLHEYLRERVPDATVSREGNQIVIRRGTGIVTTPVDAKPRWPSGNLRFDIATVPGMPEGWQYATGYLRDITWSAAAIWWAALLLLSALDRPRLAIRSIAMLMLVISAGMYLTALSVRPQELLRFSESQPTGWAALMAAVSLAILVRGSFMSRQRPTHPVCRACGYNLTGNTSGVCPECGSSTAAKSAPIPGNAP